MPRPPRRVRVTIRQPEVERLGARDRAIRERVLAVVGRSRREKVPIAQAARAAHVSQASVRRFAAPAVRADERGRLVAKTRDTLPRHMQVITSGGPVSGWTTSSGDARLLGRYAAAVGQFLRDGHPRHLRPFRNRTVTLNGTRYALTTDPSVLTDLGDAGLLDDFTPYVEGAA